MNFCIPKKGTITARPAALKRKLSLLSRHHQYLGPNIYRTSGETPIMLSINVLWKHPTLRVSYLHGSFAPSKTRLSCSCSWEYCPQKQRGISTNILSQTVQVHSFLNRQSRVSQNKHNTLSDLVTNPKSSHLGFQLTPAFLSNCQVTTLQDGFMLLFKTKRNIGYLKYSFPMLASDTNHPL